MVTQQARSAAQPSASQIEPALPRQTRQLDRVHVVGAQQLEQTMKWRLRFRVTALAGLRGQKEVRELS